MAELKDKEIKDYPYQNDPLAPKADELAVIRKLEAAVAEKPELLEQLRLEPNPWAFLIRFSRGYYYNQFKALPDKERLESTVRIVLRTLEWRRQNKVQLLASKHMPRREAFDRVWVSGVSGFTPEGRPLYVVHPFDPSMMETFSKEEVAWLHWQEYEWLANLKAQKMQETGHLILDHVVILDFGDGTIVKAPSPSKSGIDWLRDAIKWEPPGMQAGESKMDVDSHCYPESLNRLYMLNCNVMIRGLWNIAKLFVYPTTREKFRIMGSDVKDILRQFADDKIPMSAVPAYLGGAGLNPPGLVLNRAIKKGAVEIYVMSVPAGHSLSFRFCAGKVAVTVEGNYLDETKKASQIFPSQSVAEKWVEGKEAARSGAGTVEFRFSAAASASIAFEVTALPGPGKDLACNQASATVKQ